MQPSNDNKTASTIDSKADTANQPPFRDGHENETITEHLSDVGSDHQDGFGNAQWDTRAKKNESIETTIEEKIPPAF